MDIILIKVILRYASFLSNNFFDEEQKDVMLSMSMVSGDGVTFVIFDLYILFFKRLIFIFSFCFSRDQGYGPLFNKIDLKNRPS